MNEFSAASNSYLDTINRFTFNIKNSILQFEVEIPNKQYLIFKGLYCAVFPGRHLSL